MIILHHLFSSLTLCYLYFQLNITASVALVSNAEVIVHGSDYHVQLPENITLTATVIPRTFFLKVFFLLIVKLPK